MYTNPPSIFPTSPVWNLTAREAHGSCAGAWYGLEKRKVAVFDLADVPRPLIVYNSLLDALRECTGHIETL